MKLALKHGFGPSGVVVCAFFTFATIGFAGTYSGGTGDPNDPYRISTVTDWQELIAASGDWGKHFVLLNDIDFKDVSLTPIAPDSDPSKSDFQGVTFTGNFDGRHHALQHVKIDLPSNDYVGLFGLVGSGGQIINLSVKEIGISARTKSGGIVGCCNGNLKDCTVTGSITATGGSIGGLVGVGGGGTLIQCSAKVTVFGSGPIGGLVGDSPAIIQECFASGSVHGEDVVGGLVGAIGRSTIRDSYSTANVEGISNVAGLVGAVCHDMNIINCFATGHVSGSYNLGGFARPGYDSQRCIVIGFWNIETSGQNGSYGGIGKTTAEMMDRMTYMGWGPAWTLRDGQDYPHLAWENAGGEPLVRFSGGSGTAEEPYRISTVDDWQELTLVWTDWDKHYILTNDLDMEGVTVLSVGPNYGIDYSKRGFTGVLNGAGHVIRNLSRILPTDANSLPGSSGAWESNNVGLFGEVGPSGVIRQLGLENLQIRNDSNDYDDSSATGGLVGHNEGEISECYATGRIEGKGGLWGGSYIGGLVGQHYRGLIQLCRSDVVVQCSGGTVGGLVGFNGFDGSAIISCYATRPVEGAAGYAGGLVGYNDGLITDCYAIGPVLGEVTGGLVGRNSVTRGEIRGCFWEQDVSGMAGSGGGKGLSSQEMKTLRIFQNAGWTGNGWVMRDGEDYPRLEWEGLGGIPIPDPEPFPLTGSGTEEYPFQIGTPEEFALLSWYPAILDKHIVLINDLDLAGIKIYPIGDLGFFSGNFDGRGYVLRNVKLSMPNSDYIGLFGNLYLNGRIQNVTMEDVDVAGRHYVGGLVGWSISGDPGITGCSIRGTILGNSYVGGLAGYGSGTLSECHTEGDVDGMDYVGGLVGDAWGKILSCSSSTFVNGGDYAGGLIGTVSFNTITSCWASGPVTGTYSVGGLIGSSGHTSVQGCCATGSVTGTGYSIGGFVGSCNEYSSMKYCFSTGAVRGDSGVGGFAGRTDWFGNINSCYATGDANGIEGVGGLVGFNGERASVSGYSVGRVHGQSRTGGLVGSSYWGGSASGFWDIQTSGQSISPGGGTGKTTAQMKTKATYSSWDFANTWAICEGTNYPRLKWQIPATDWVCPDGVAMEDLLYFAQRWMAGTPETAGTADVDGSGKVDLSDFVLLSEQWMK